jgi:hypothetical protein
MRPVALVCGAVAAAQAGVRVVFTDVHADAVGPAVETLASIAAHATAVFVLRGSDADIARRLGKHHVGVALRPDGTSGDYAALTEAGVAVRYGVGPAAATSLGVVVIADVQDVHPENRETALRAGHVAVPAASATAVVGALRCLQGRARAAGLAVVSVDAADNARAYAGTSDQKTAPTQCPWTRAKRTCLGSPVVNVLAVVVLLLSATIFAMCVYARRAKGTKQ